MKNFTLITLIIPLLFFGCNKADSKDEHVDIAEKVNVNLKVGNFKVEQSPIKSTTTQNTTDKPLIRRLKLLIYDQTQKLVETIDQYGSEANFGNFQLELIRGVYSIGIVGYDTGEFIRQGRDPMDHFIRFPLINKSGALIKNQSSITEVFEYGYDTIKIESDTTFQPFNLTRITSTLEVKITDPIPNNAAWLMVSTNQDSKINIFSKNLLVPDWNFIDDGGVYLYDLSKLKGTSGNSFSSAVIPYTKDGTKFDVYISVVDANKKGLFNNLVKDVDFKSNYLTRLTGALGAINSKKFSVNIVKQYTDTLDINF
nr:hypothetical protein [uncultured Sphingobacterium sp.]